MRTLPYTSALFALLLLPLSAGPAAGQPVDTFRVTTESEKPEHPYYQEGFGIKFAIDGVQGKELILEKGKEYLFQMDEVPSIHPFYLSTSPIGEGDGVYSNGVNGNFATGNAQLTFTPPSDAPDSLWYQCNSHPKMGWRMALVEDSSQATVDSDGAVLFNDTGVTINFSGTSGSGTVTVDKFNSAPEGTEEISESDVSEYRFVIAADGDLSFNSNTEVRFDVSTLLGIDNANNVTVYKRSTVGSGSFIELSTNYDSDANELVATTGSFSEFVMASNTEGLPVEMVSFDARIDGATPELTWRTATEQNNAGFEVQRKVVRPSSESTAWGVLGFVESKASGGTTTETTRYRFRDKGAPFEAGRIAYRLRQVDTDGSSHLSRTVTVRLDAPDRLVLHVPFPNPTTGQATIRYELPRAAETQLTLYNALGQRVATLAQGRQSAGRQEIQFGASELASGTYLLRLRAGGQVQTRQLTILR